MRVLNIERKTGFSSLLPFKIYDKSGFLFYSDSFVNKIGKGVRLNFNLPKGQYKYNGILTKLSQPVKHKEIILPIRERTIPNNGYKIIWGDNPNKCTIFYDKGIILFDNSLKKIPMYMKFHIYFHEMGHHLYKTEKLADLYAAKRMLELGFNPSQIGYSSLETLSEKQNERKEFLVNHLTKK